MSRRGDVLCGCGWGRLNAPLAEIPEWCPVCGFHLWELRDEHIDAVYEAAGKETDHAE